MQATELYKSIYRLWDDITPLCTDCGTLCNHACCKPDPFGENGMYLFPGEEKLFYNNANYRVLDTAFYYTDTKHAKLVVCRGACQRDMRPLSCRIFPYVPYYRKGSGFKIIPDPRAYSVCPLARNYKYVNFEKKYFRAIHKTFSLLTRFSVVCDFLEGLSDILDDCNNFR